MGKGWTVPKNPRSSSCGWRPGVHPSRWPAIREWRCAHGHSAQQVAQGSGGEVEDDGRLHHALRAGLGLPRAADRIQGRERNCRARSTGDPPTLRGVCREIHRHPARVIPAPGCVWRLGKSLSHDGASLRGGHFAGLCQAGGKRQRLSIEETRAVVLRRADRTRRSGGGIPGQGKHRGVCEISTRQRHARRQGVDRDLDDHAMDAARQPRPRGAPGVHLCDRPLRK